MGRFEIVASCLKIVVDRCGSLWIVVGRCGSFRVLVTTVPSLEIRLCTSHSTGKGFDWLRTRVFSCLVHLEPP